MLLQTLLESAALSESIDDMISAWHNGDTAALERDLQAWALASFEALECRDFARVDFKLDSKGGARFLEINTLPTFAPDGSFGILAELAGRSYADFVGEVLAEALARLGLAS